LFCWLVLFGVQGRCVCASKPRGAVMASVRTGKGCVKGGLCVVVWVGDVVGCGCFLLSGGGCGGVGGSVW